MLIDVIHKIINTPECSTHILINALSKPKHNVRYNVRYNVR